MNSVLIPRPEHPNPQWERTAWKNLNGEWQFEIDYSKSGEARELFRADSLAGSITLPFCPESELSGVGIKDFMYCVWYRREVILPEGWVKGVKEAGEKVILHFGAVDYLTTVYVNGKQVGTHKGGYASFAFDITHYINVEDGKRLERALMREQQQDHPNYEELCRRFLADSKDFSKDNLDKANIKKYYQNNNLNQCLEEIKVDIDKMLL